MKLFLEVLGGMAYSKWEDWANCKYQFIPNLFSAIHDFCYDKYITCYFTEKYYK